MDKINTLDDDVEPSRARGLKLAIVKSVVEAHDGRALTGSRVETSTAVNR